MTGLVSYLDSRFSSCKKNKMMDGAVATCERDSIDGGGVDCAEKTLPTKTSCRRAHKMHCTNFVTTKELGQDNTAVKRN